jgi:hypothetical protein
MNVQKLTHEEASAQGYRAATSGYTKGEIDKGFLQRAIDTYQQGEAVDICIVNDNQGRPEIWRKNYKIAEE